MPAPPLSGVLAEFGVEGAQPETLAGGRGTAWRAGDVVLKPLDMSIDALRWQANVLSSVVPDDFRVAVPLRTHEGELVVDGWTAWPALTGGHAERWLDIVAVGERFHRALGDVERPSALLDARTDGWARAGRLAWGELPAGRFSDVPELARLLAVRQSVNAPDQLVHGDLSGNVLFADGLPPAVVDLSPYWRPAAYASAVVVVDAVLWHGADIELLSTVAGRRGGQFLVRALLFRLLSERNPASASTAHRPAVEYVCPRQLTGSFRPNRTAPVLKTTRLSAGFGSTAAHLIDEYRILVQPVLLGKWRSFLKDGAERVNLDLVDTTVIPSGVAILTYQPVR